MGERGRSSEAGEASPSPKLFPVTPLFPLPNIVLFPRAVLPLHIFEERYKQMTADALAGPRRIAMALLKPGWERDYYQRPAIEPVVCVGQIMTHEQLPDGKYNFFLQGVARARVVREYRDKDYRVADLERLPEVEVADDDLSGERRRIADLLEGDLRGLAGAKQFSLMLKSPLPTASVADLLAFHLLEELSVAEKQAILAETDPRRRVAAVIDALQAIEPPPPPVAKLRIPPDPTWN